MFNERFQKIKKKKKNHHLFSLSKVKYEYPSLPRTVIAGTGYRTAKQVLQERKEKASNH